MPTCKLRLYVRGVCWCRLAALLFSVSEGTERSATSSLCSFSGGGRGGVSRQTGFRLLVSGLPQSASWQDLKDTCRRYGDVTFTQVRLLALGYMALGIIGSLVHVLKVCTSYQDSRWFSNPACHRAGDAGQPRPYDRHCGLCHKGRHEGIFGCIVAI